MGTTQGLVWTNLVPFHPVVLKKKTLINFHFFNQSEAVILGLRMNKVTWHNFGRGPFKFGPI
jgi:hypothetical protein